MLQLAFSTYGMRDEDPFRALPRLREIGYDAVELAVSEGWPTSHDRLDADDRERLVDLLRDLDVPPPHLVDLSVEPLAAGEARTETLDRFEASCRLAADLDFGDGPAIVKSTAGGDPDVDVTGGAITDDILELADIAAANDAIFAVEPHVGQALNTPEKAAWLLDRADHPALGLAFDVSHFPPPLFDTERAVERCAPHAVTTHVKDTEVVDGEFRFRLPGETDFDYGSFLQRLVEHGYEGPITVEVSAQLWDEPDYDPWAAARFCHDALREPVAAANRHPGGSS